MGNKFIKKKMLDAIFKAKTQLHQALAREPFEKKIRMLVNLQKIANSIRASLKRKPLREIWSIIIMFCLAIPAAAQTLDIGVISSGGMLDATGGGYTLHDLKGQSVIGESTAADGTKVEVGGLYGLIPWGGIVSLVIERDGNDIKLTWSGPTPDIYYQTGDGTGVFDNTYVVAKWSKVTPGSDGFSAVNGTSIWHNNQVEGVTGSNPEVYYKGLQAGTVPTLIDPTSGLTFFEAAGAMGKVDVTVERHDINISFYSFSVPLVPLAGDIFSSVFPLDKFVQEPPSGNLLEADQVREWDGAGWKSYFRSSDGEWRRTDTKDQAVHTFGRGYVLRLQPASKSPEKTFVVTSIGEVLTSGVYSSDTAHGGKLAVGKLGEVKFTAFGNPFPKLSTFKKAFLRNESDLQSATLNLLEADQVRYWDYLTGGWKSSYFDSTDWKLTSDQTKPAFDFWMSKGFVFRKADNSPKGGFIWKYQIQ